MNRSLSTQATAFSLAALVTLTLLAGIQQLAQTPAAHELAAAAASASSATQVVVVTGKRDART
jgi:uncharacterized lipoprotein YajG